MHLVGPDLGTAGVRVAAPCCGGVKATVERGLAYATTTTIPTPIPTSANSDGYGDAHNVGDVTAKVYLDDGPEQATPHHRRT